MSAERAISPMDDLVILLDDSGEPIGTRDRVAVHTTETPLHLAFSAYIFDAAGRVLVTRRAIDKKTWPGVWTNSCCGHPRPAESLDDAVRRRVFEELGLELSWVKPALPDFRYRAVDASGIVENEICPVFIAVTNNPHPDPDPDEVMEYDWIDWPDLVRASTSARAVFSPWCVLQIPELDRVVESTLPPPSPEDSDLVETQRDIDELLSAAAGTLTSIWSRYISGPPVDLTGHSDDLPQWMERLMLHGGKRFRSIMAHWGFASCGGTQVSPGREHMVRSAAALETLHFFALVHDDVMDESTSRRGLPSAHVQVTRHHVATDGHGEPTVHGRNLAILLGDLAHAEADRIAAGLPSAMHEYWYELSIELIAGQRADLTQAASAERDFKQAEHIARLKSGSYTIERPLQLGAMAAWATTEQRDALARYGRHCGTAFALRDDILGVWGDPEVTGKPAGDDLRNGKVTAILALGEKALRGRAAKALARVGAPDARLGDITILQEALCAAGVRDQVEQMISDEVEQAQQVLAGSPLTKNGVAGLSAMVERVAWRNS